MTAAATPAMPDPSRSTRPPTPSGARVVEDDHVARPLTRETKKPCNANGRTANAQDARNQLPFWRAQGAIAANRALGFGYVVADGDGLACIDIDKCRDATTGAIDPRAIAIIERFAGASWEPSPSGTGVHIWVRVDPTLAVNRKATWDGAHSLEIASVGKFFTVTDPAVGPTTCSSRKTPARRSGAI